MSDLDGELTEMQAATIRALASPHRLGIIGLLRDGPREVNEISRHLGAAQATVSQHLAVMRAAGLVDATRDGRVVRYRLADPEVGDACDVMRRTIVRRMAADRRTPDDVIESTPAQVSHA